MVRAFIGVPIPENIKRYVTDVQVELNSLPIKSKLVEFENLHISLSFLGDIDESTVETIKSKLDGISKLYKIFEISIGDILLIPNEKFTRVIALDVESEVLETLRKEIVNLTGGESHPAHLTLARVKIIDDRRVFLQKIKEIDVIRKNFIIGGIYLFESKLRKGGPAYIILHMSHLK